MRNDAADTPLADYLTLRDIARELNASYYSAYSLAASGLLGEALVIAGKHFYRRSMAEPVIARRLEQRRQHGRCAPLVGVA